MKRDLSKMTCIEDLRRVAQRKVPRMFYDYADSGSWTESTYRANSSDFQDIKFRQRVLVDMEGRSLATKMIGEEVKMPLAIAPTGFTGMQHADGEILAARAAEKFGVPFSLSTMSICSIEDVAENTSAPFWFQLYVMRDREFMENLIKRAQAAKCSALILTADLQVLGQRLRGVGLRHQAEVDQHTIEGATHFALRRQRALQIARGQPAGAHQQVAVIRPADAAQCG